MRYVRISLVISSLLLANTTFAAAFQFYEQGTPIIGTAAVGQAAVAQDASIAYFNPSGMTALSTSQYMLGSELILPSTHFSVGGQNTIPGNNGGDAGSLMPAVDLYYVYSYSSSLKVGVSFNSPYNGSLTYNDGWVGRYSVQQTQLYTLDLNPSIAYQVNKWLSLGAGVVVEYANLSQTVALPISADENGQADVKVDSYAPGFNLGATITPSPATRIGIAYRSQISHDFDGTTTFLNIPETPNTTTNMVMPQNVIVSLQHAITTKFNLLGELGWANWSSMEKSVVVVDGYSAVTTLDWHDTYRAGVGGQYKLGSSVMLQGGVSYDSSPTDASNRTPDLPMDRQIRAGIGLIYAVMPAVKLGFSYEYINFGNADIDNTSSNGTLDGSYSKNYANIAQLSINVNV